MKLRHGATCVGLLASTTTTIKEIQAISSAEAEYRAYNYEPGVSHEAERMAEYRAKREAMAINKENESQIYIDSTVTVFKSFLKQVHEEDPIFPNSDIDGDFDNFESKSDEAGIFSKDNEYEDSQKLRILENMEQVSIKIVTENPEMGEKMKEIATQLEKNEIEEDNSASNNFNTANFMALGGARGSASLRTSKIIGMTDFGNIWRYGCWCSFGDRVLEGRGEPKDDIDRACRDLTLAMRCVDYDSKIGTCTDNCDETCDARNVMYNRPVQRPGENADTSSYLQCSRSNKRSKCKLWSCSVETDFAKKLVDFFFKSVNLQDRYVHDFGFNPAYECQSLENADNKSNPQHHNNLNPLNQEKKPGNWMENQKKSKDVDRSIESLNGKKIADPYDSFTCCGEYPARKMISSQMFGCCPRFVSKKSKMETQYVKSHQECCADGTVMNIGECSQLNYYL